MRIGDAVAPLRVRGLKPPVLLRVKSEVEVAPLRVRGLKLNESRGTSIIDSRTFAGAWIET